MFKNKTKKTKNNITEDDWVTLGEHSEGYSGSDVAIVVNEALMMPVRKCQQGKRFKQTPDGGWIPTFPSDPEGKDMTLMDVRPDLLRCPDVTIDDLMAALAKIKPSVCDKDI
jgi:vacuolar protein-sorting-associated protein 4